jgi:predicted permease
VLLARIRSLAKGLWRRSQVESDMADELRLHIELRADDLVVRERLTRQEALRRARLEFGSIEKYKEESRAARGLRFFDALRGDVQYSWRQLRRYPVFTLTALLTIAFGIGVNAAMFSIVNGWLRPLPVRNAGELTVLANLIGRNPVPNPLVSFPEYVDYKNASGAFADMAAWTGVLGGMTADGRTDHVYGVAVSGNYFSMLGVQPALGRLISPVDGDLGGNVPIMVLGYSYWSHKLAKDPSVVGKEIKLEGRPYTVIGVVPESFHGTNALTEADAYLPLDVSSVRPYFSNRDVSPVRIIARLKPEVNLEQAQAALDVISKRLQQEYPATNTNRTMHVFSERLSRPDPSTARVMPYFVVALLVLAGAVLAIACANVLSLFLVRGLARRGEMAVRTALGAGRWQLIRICLVEAFLISAFGGVVGAAAGTWAAQLLENVSLPGLDGLILRLDFSTDWRVMAYAIVLVFVTTAFVGLIPALRAARTNPHEDLHQVRVAAAPQTQRLRHVLVAAQLAASVAFLMVTGLFIQNLHNLESLDLGFARDRMLLVDMDQAMSGYSGAQVRTIYKAIETRLQSLPGVESVAQAALKPFGGITLDMDIAADGAEVRGTSERPTAEANFVSPGYFQTLGIALIRGRAFTEADADSEKVRAIVSEAMAIRLWPNQDPIGKKFRAPIFPDQSVEVLGVVRSTKQSDGFQPLKPPPPQFFLPAGAASPPIRTFYIRTSGKPESLSVEVVSAIRSIDPNVSIEDVTTMQQQIRGSVNGFGIPRMFVFIAGVFGLLALLLALVGTYGALSFMVGQRTHEIGVRIALGADGTSVLRIVLRDGLRLALAGIVAGLMAGAALGRLFRSLLLDVSPLDPVVSISVALLLLAAALVTCLLPGRKAVRIDPILALKSE